MNPMRNWNSVLRLITLIHYPLYHPHILAPGIPKLSPHLAKVLMLLKFSDCTGTSISTGYGRKITDDNFSASRYTF